MFEGRQVLNIVVQVTCGVFSSSNQQVMPEMNSRAIVLVLPREGKPIVDWLVGRN